MPIVIRKCSVLIRNTLRGFIDVELPSGMIMHDVAMHEKDGQRWAQPPSKPQIDRNQQPITKDGKLQYTPIISFASKELRQLFSDAVVKAAEAAHPELFP